MTKKDLILPVAILILTIVQLVSLFRSKKTDTHTPLLLSAKDEIIKLYEKEREVVNVSIENTEKYIKLLEEKDSILSAKYSNDQKIYKLLNEKLQVVDITLARVRNNNDSLRAIANSLED